MRFFIKGQSREAMIRRGYPSFWMVNTVGWILFILMDTILSPEIWNSPYRMLTNGLEWTMGYFITIGLRAIYKEFSYEKKSYLSILFTLLICSQLAAFLLYITSHAMYLIIEHPDFYKTMKIFMSFRYLSWKQTQLMPLMTTWSLLYFGIKLWLDLTKERERAEKADLLAQSAQLQMLRYQVNPHFLFNSFSSLRALIRSDKTKAEEMVSKLSEFYRYTLVTRNNSEVPLIEETDAIMHYFDIEKIRFGDKIEFSVDIDPLAEEYPIPCFLLHPLVENAIKYGMKTSELPLQVKLKAEVRDHHLHICVANSGKWVEAEKSADAHGTGTGLTNVKSRLDYSYPGTHSFEVKEEDGLVKIFVEIFRELK